MEQSELFNAIVRAPEDDTPRLLLADWLEKHGDPHRAKYIRTTTVRGIDFEWHFPQQMSSILDSPAARQFTRISFASRPEKRQPCPVSNARKGTRIPARSRRC